jgi:serine protease
MTSGSSKILGAWWFAGLLSLVLASSSNAPIVAQSDLAIHAVHRLSPGRGSIIPGEIIVGFAVATGLSGAQEAVREVGGMRARASHYGGVFLVTLEPGRDMQTALAQLQARPDVEYAEPNGRVSAFFAPNDPRFDLQWHFRLLGVERTWDIQRGDPSIAVAVLDTGIAYEDYGKFRKAPDFAGTVFLPGLNVLDGTPHANDDNFHGTHVASTIAEATNNDLGAAGLAFQCALMPVKVLDSEGDGSFFDVAEGIDYATNFRSGDTNPIKVINLSLGGDFESETVSRAIERAVAAGITVVAAAGNDGHEGISFPAAHPDVIAVGAVDGRGERAVYSNTGPELDVMAPGGDLDRDDDEDGYPDGVLQQTFSPSVAASEGRYDDFGLFFVDGTSQAAPHVAAIAALLYHQGITEPAAVKQALESTAKDLGAAGHDDDTGHGLIQPAAALSGLGLNR